MCWVGESVTVLFCTTEQLYYVMGWWIKVLDWSEATFMFWVCGGTPFMFWPDILG
jgi:hypothetical protein